LGLAASTSDGLGKIEQRILPIRLQFSAVFADGMSIAHRRLSFLVTKAVLTHSHRNIQSVHNGCVAVMTRTRTFLRQAIAASRT